MRLSTNLKFNVKELLDKIQTNRAKHNSEYEKALVQYKKELKEELEEKLVKLTENKDIHPHSNLVVPIRFSKDYDKAYDMLDMTSQNEIELDQRTFCQLVRDEWDWQQDFARSTTAYSSKFK